MPLMSTSNPEAAVARWILRAAEWSDAELSSRAPADATSTISTNAPAYSQRRIVRAESDGGALTDAANRASESDSDSDSGASGDEVDSAEPKPIPPFPPVRELHPSLRNIIPPFPPIRELHPSLRGLRMGEAGAPTLVHATWTHELSDARAPVFSKPPRDADASGARGACAPVIGAGDGDDVIDTDHSAQYSSEGENHVEDSDRIEIKQEQDVLYYVPEPQHDERSQDVMIKDEDEDGWDGVDHSEIAKWALKYYDSDSDAESQCAADDKESDFFGDDEEGTLVKRYCSDDDLLPPPQKKRKLNHMPAAHAAVSQRVPIARTRGRALGRAETVDRMAVQYILN